MKLEIQLMGVDGQAFLVDEETGIEYYKHDIDQEIVPLADQPYACYPINLQNIVLARKELYENKEFSSLEEANKFLSKTGLEWEIKDTEKWEPISRRGRRIKEKCLKLYKEDLKKYE